MATGEKKMRVLRALEAIRFKAERLRADIASDNMNGHEWDSFQANANELHKAIIAYCREQAVV